MAKGLIDVGAPILDFSFKTSTGEANSVVTNGVVVQPGYDPIIITPTKTNEDN